jgi:hypothetical protein
MKNPNPVFNISKSGTWKYSSVNSNFDPLYYDSTYTGFSALKISNPWEKK